jgi:hypothetical protein
MWKSADRAPSLRVLPWHLPDNWGKKNGKTCQGKKNLSQSTVYILPKHPHTVTKTPTHYYHNTHKLLPKHPHIVTTKPTNYYHNTHKLLPKHPHIVTTTPTNYYHNTHKLLPKHPHIITKIPTHSLPKHPHIVTKTPTHAFIFTFSPSTNIPLHLLLQTEGTTTLVTSDWRHLHTCYFRLKAPPHMLLQTEGTTNSPKRPEPLTECHGIMLKKLQLSRTFLFVPASRPSVGPPRL